MSFSPREFLAANALPGPDSHIYCIIQKDGLFGETVSMTFSKHTEASLIPGLTYGTKPITYTRMPTGWSERIYTRSALRSIRLKQTAKPIVVAASDPKLKEKPQTKSYQWTAFKTYCKTNNIHSIK